MSELKMYYFGPIRNAGHYFWYSDTSSSYDIEKLQPWGYIDGKLPPQTKEQQEGEALLHHKDGWTAISFWDRSVDNRGDCNSTYLANANLTFDEMVSLAQERFPARWAVMYFEVKEATKQP